MKRIKSEKETLNQLIRQLKVGDLVYLDFSGNLNKNFLVVGKFLGHETDPERPVDHSCFFEIDEVSYNLLEERWEKDLDAVHGCPYTREMLTGENWGYFTPENYTDYMVEIQRSALKDYITLTPTLPFIVAQINVELNN